MSVEIRLKASYSLVKFFIKLVNYHIEILKQELEAKARDEEEIRTELEFHRNLRMKILLYLGRVSENIEMSFDEEDMIVLDKICYLHSMITNKIMKVDERLVKELEQFYMQVKEWVMIVQGDESKYLN
ncbi:hypothetical protein [Anaerophilus nitritogenes]|jgi:hypothetical protein|uniref:hypothetical protein n=1 Tax=Anaerophilus nitritogenes TaxID=2498136 RepID=UPI00101BF234|nr:hypothetical protein [Anaerophilus nitritogenes]